MLNFIKRHWPTALAALILLTAVTGVYAKYVMDEALDGKATITANLGTIAIWESLATADTTGQYKLDKTADPVKANKYEYVIPGLDIPKDPYVQITDKSAIPVYVFVEVVSTLTDSAITYEVDTANWLKLENVTGKNGGTVYVYALNSSAKAVDSNLGPIYILEGNQVIVGQSLNKKNTSNLGLSFYACMGQVDAGANAAAVYTNLFNPGSNP